MLQRISMLFACVALLLAAGCEPQTAAERAYFEQKEAEKQQQRDLKIQLRDTAMKDSEVVGIVSSNVAPDSIGTTDDWLKRQIDTMEGQVLFPRWKVLRRSNAKYEVQYAFSVIDSQNRIIKRGYQWQVDTLVKVVGKPRDLVFAEQQAATAAPSADSKVQQRLAEEEASLE